MRNAQCRRRFRTRISPRFHRWSRSIRRPEPRPRPCALVTSATGMLTCAVAPLLRRARSSYMSTTISTPQKKFRSYVPDDTTMPEFTLRAVLLGLVLTVILGAANAYLGLRAGMTIAATYPAAVIGMAVLRIMKGSILEENIERTVGSGGALGILFVTLLRRVMVEDPELPFPESVAASQIHIAGQQGSRAAKILFGNMGFGGLVYLLGQFNLFNASKDFIVNVGNLGTSFVRMGRLMTSPKLSAGPVTTVSAPAISPAYLGVGYIIGPRLASLNFAGGVIAWGLLVPLI